MKKLQLDAVAAMASSCRLHDHVRVHAPRERTEAVSRRCPCHTGWKAFTDVFGKASLGYQADADAKCAPLIPVESQYREKGTLLLVERPADSRRLAFPKQVQNFASSLQDDTQCISLLGYWQRYSLYAGLRPQLRDAMRVQDGDLEERPDSDDVVVHVRLCDGPVHQYKYYSWKNYFSHVLPRINPPPK